MKKKIFAVLLTGALALSPCIPVFADAKDDKIAQLENQISEMQKTIDELQKQLDEASSGAKSTSQDTYKIGESYVVEGQWKITVDSVEATDDRNEYSDKNPAAVYLVTYTYENLGYDDDLMNGLYISLEDGIVDNTGKMGYSYPGNISMYPQETPIGASCQAQTCIGVDNAGSFKINFYTYDSNGKKQSAIFEIDV
jgi:protein involved in sex pheromone biosynthesis